MIPAGYMAKDILKRPDWLKAPNVADIYSLSACVSPYFVDYINFWRHNGYWLFDSPEIILDLARANNIDMSGKIFFYYETCEREYSEVDGCWQRFRLEPSLTSNVQLPKRRNLEGFDVVSFSGHTAPECSPLSCNGLAENVPVNTHCLLNSVEEARLLIESGALQNGEPGPYRIFAVYSLPDFDSCSQAFEPTSLA